jgi:hypothetical protein
VVLSFRHRRVKGMIAGAWQVRARGQVRGRGKMRKRARGRGMGRTRGKLLRYCGVVGALEQ